MISKDRGAKSKQIFDEIYERIKKSGLIQELHEIRIVTCGNIDNLNNNFNNYDKCKVVEHCDDLSKWEFPTLIKMKKDAEILEDNVPILYLHLKGITSNTHDWRRRMLGVVVDKYLECNKFLHDYNAVGTQYSEPYIRNGKMPRHFSGNFWWTSVRHLKNLPNPEIQDMIRDYGFLVEGRKNKNPAQPSNQNYRYLSEVWIGFLDMEDEHKLKEVK